MQQSLLTIISHLKCIHNRREEIVSLVTISSQNSFIDHSYPQDCPKESNPTLNHRPSLPAHPRTRRRLRLDRRPSRRKSRQSIPRRPTRTPPQNHLHRSRIHRHPNPRPGDIPTMVPSPHHLHPSRQHPIPVTPTQTPRAVHPFRIARRQRTRDPSF